MMFNCSLALFTGTSEWSGGVGTTTFQPRGSRSFRLTSAEADCFS